MQTKTRSALTLGLTGLTLALLVPWFSPSALFGSSFPFNKDTSDGASISAIHSDTPDSLAAALFSSTPANNALLFEKTLHNPFITGLEQLPEYLQGTEVEGSLQVDADGNLLVSVDLRNVFEYFFALLGTESLDTISQRIQAWLQHQLPAPAATQAQQILTRYLAYKTALSEVEKTSLVTDDKMDLDAIRLHMQQEQELRDTFFAADVATAFFEADDRFNRYALQRAALLLDESTAPAMQMQQLAQLEANLPPAWRRGVAETRTVEQAMQLESATHASEESSDQGVSAEQLYQQREQLFGSDAATGLQTLDQRRAQWQQRLSLWRAERASILASPGLADSDKQALLNTLRAERFASHELPRALALESISGNR